MFAIPARKNFCVVQEQMIPGAHQSSALCQRERRNTTGRIDDMCKQQRDFGIFFN